MYKSSSRYSFLYQNSILGLAVAACALPSPWLAAQPPEDGSPFLVNSYQTSSQQRSSLSGEAGGTFIVVWHGNSNHDSTGIAGQLFGPDGSVGPALEVNTGTQGRQDEAAVSMAPDGSFVVTWDHFLSSYPVDENSVRAQRFASDGSKLGSEMQVETHTTGVQAGSEVTFIDSGEFVVAWQSEGSDGNDQDGYSIQAQIFASDGMPVAGEFQVNSDIVGDQTEVALAPQAGGGFIAAWTSAVGSGSSINAQRFDSTGLPIGGEFVTTAFTTTQPTNSSVASDGDGDFVITWTLDDYSGIGRRYASDGSDMGFIDIGVSGFDTHVDMNSQGDFVITSHGFFGGGTAKVWAADGQVKFERFPLPYSGNFGAETGALLDDDGVMVIVWTADANNLDIEGQRYLGPLVFQDGFELGDLGAWASTAP